MTKAKRAAKWRRNEINRAAKALIAKELRGRLTESQKQAAIKDLSMLNGLPPYDEPMNFCFNDNYFAADIARRYGMSLNDLSVASGYDKIVKNWERIQHEAYVKFERSKQ
jgi:hypothetical protein